MLQQDWEVKKGMGMRMTYPSPGLGFMLQRDWEVRKGMQMTYPRPTSYFMLYALYLVRSEDKVRDTDKDGAGMTYTRLSLYFTLCAFRFKETGKRGRLIQDLPSPVFLLFFS